MSDYRGLYVKRLATGEIFEVQVKDETGISLPLTLESYIQRKIDPPYKELPDENYYHAGDSPGDVMKLTALSVSDIREIIKLAKDREMVERPREYSAADSLGSAWDGWREATAKLTARIESLSAAARAELIALAWLGRGDSGNDFDALVAHAARSSDAGDSRYLAAKSPLHVYLAEGATALGLAI